MNFKESLEYLKKYGFRIMKEDTETLNDEIDDEYNELELLRKQKASDKAIKQQWDKASDKYYDSKDYNLDAKIENGKTYLAKNAEAEEMKKLKIKEPIDYFIYLMKQNEYKLVKKYKEEDYYRYVFKKGKYAIDTTFEIDGKYYSLNWDDSTDFSGNDNYKTVKECVEFVKKQNKYYIQRYEW